MNPLESLRMLAGARRAEGTSIRMPGNVCMTQMEAVADSVDGTVRVDPGGMVISQDGSQHIDLPTIGNVREGDLVNVALVGDDGSAKSMVALAPVGEGDRQQEEIEEAATTATKYITELEDGIMVHPEGDETSGWSIREALELLRRGVSVIRAWYDDAKESALVRVGAEDGSHMVMGSDSIDLMEAASSLIGRFTGHVNGAVRTLLMTLGDDQWGTGEVEAQLEPGSLASAMLRARANGITTSRGYAGVSASVEGDGQGTGYGHVCLTGDYIEASFGLSGFRRGGMAEFADLLGCQIRIAYGEIAVPANSAASGTFTWVGGRRFGADVPMAFNDAAYIVSITRTGMPNGFDKVGYTVTDRTAGTVTVTAWNSNAYAVTQMLMLIGIDVRHSEWD